MALRVLRGLVDRQPGGALALALTFFAGNAFAEFQSIIHAHSTAVGINDVIFWNDVIVNAAPPAIEPKPWVELLDSLTTEVICAATYQQWWTTCQGEQTIGHLRTALDKAPQNETTAVFRKVVIPRIATNFTDAVREATNASAIAIWANILAQVAPPEREPGLWLDFLYTLTERKPALYICASYSWELRSRLLRLWGSRTIEELIAADKSTIRQLRRWLTVYWSEFEQLLSFELPDSWFRLTMIEMLNTIPDTSSLQEATNQTVMANPEAGQQTGSRVSHHPAYNVPPQEIVRIVARHSDRFVDMLEDLICRSDESERSTAIRFFALLAEHGYEQKLPLLSRMLIKLPGEKDAIAARLLLAAASLDKQEKARLLESYFTPQLSRTTLPASYVELLKLYLPEFAVNDLKRLDTRRMLQLLQRQIIGKYLLLPEEQNAQVQLWCKIGEFLDNPVISQSWLRDLRYTIRDRLSPTPTVRTELTSLLLDKLVLFADSEAKLTRVIDNLGLVLMGSDDARYSPELRLLERMAEKAGVLFGGARPSRALMPYITLFLQEADSLDARERETFIMHCLFDCLKLDRSAIQVIQSYSDSWPEQVQEAWKKYTGKKPTRATSKPSAQSGPGANAHFASESKPITFAKPAQIGDTESAYSSGSGLLDKVTNSLSKVIQHFNREGQDEQQETGIASPANGGQSGVVAVVHGQPVTRQQYDHLNKVRGAYLQYRLDFLQKELRKSSYEKDLKEAELVILRQQLASSQEQQDYSALTELVDDLLIQREFADVLGQPNPPGDLDKKHMQEELKNIRGGLKKFYGDQYMFLHNRWKLSGEELEEILYIYVRRNLFTLYLDKYWSRSLNEWLREQRQRYANDIKY